MDALYFVVDSLLTFAVYAFLLRLLLPLVRNRWQTWPQ
jgi:hypothetical protein